MRGTVVKAGLAAAGLLLAAAVTAQPNMYRWVDKDGHVHYGDQPGVANAQRLETSQQPNAQGAQAQPGGGGSSGATQTASGPAADCKSKTEQLANYQNAASITETDAIGNKHEYSAEERQKLVDLTQKYVDEHCKQNP
ncbi:MAG: DUF4124 domain-containing protein [Nevskia sp.]|nr:DUF4124 domain-containing protein [Nevskia sp.]